MDHMITLNEARRIIGAAEKKASEIGQPMNIAVVDEGGNLIAHVRMDGAWIGSIDISINKAYTSRAFDIATKDLAEHSQSGGQFFGIHVSNSGRIMIFAGGGTAQTRRKGCRCNRRQRRLRRAGSCSSRGRRFWVLSILTDRSRVWQIELASKQGRLLQDRDTAKRGTGVL
jgi:uncharacterized protein GlcG (DUF336 family)